MRAQGTGNREQGKVRAAFVASFLLLSSSLLAQGPTTLGKSSLMNETAAQGMIQRRTAMRKGDILTINVVETMKGTYTASTTTNKSSSASVDRINIPLIDVFAGPVLGSILGGQARRPQQIIDGALGGGNTGSKETNSGGGTSTTTGDFRATISVVVVDVEPNGNLHVEGTKTIRVNKEDQKIFLTGTVRLDDIRPDNSVSSDRVANVDIKADGKGAVAGKTKRSLVSKILDWLL